MPVVFRLIIVFQREQIADSIELRVTQTLDALTEIARYLRGMEAFRSGNLKGRVVTTTGKGTSKAWVENGSNLIRNGK